MWPDPGAASGPSSILLLVLPLVKRCRQLQLFTNGRGLTWVADPSQGAGALGDSGMVPEPRRIRSVTLKITCGIPNPG